LRYRTTHITVKLERYLPGIGSVGEILQGAVGDEAGYTLNPAGSVHSVYWGSKLVSLITYTQLSDMNVVM
jgi:hypothetical protein